MYISFSNVNKESHLIYFLLRFSRKGGSILWTQKFSHYKTESYVNYIRSLPSWREQCSVLIRYGFAFLADNVSANTTIYGLTKSASLQRFPSTLTLARNSLYDERCAAVGLAPQNSLVLPKPASPRSNWPDRRMDGLAY